MFLVNSYRIMKLEGDRINSALAIEVHRIPDIATRFQINWKKNILQCEGIIVMYSVTSLSSLATASGHLNLVFEVRGRPDFPVVLVGNKCDLQSKRDVSYERKSMSLFSTCPVLHFLLLSEGQEIARQFGIPFFETSANEVKTVEEPFRQICSEIRKDRLVSTQHARTDFHT